MMTMKAVLEYYLVFTYYVWVIPESAQSAERRADGANLGEINQQQLCGDAVRGLVLVLPLFRIGFGSRFYVCHLHHLHLSPALHALGSFYGTQLLLHLLHLLQDGLLMLQHPALVLCDSTCPG